MMRVVISALALITCSAATAQTAPAPSEAPKTMTRTFDTPRVQGSTTIKVDREAGMFSRQTDLTRKSDGITSSRTYERTRTDNGFIESGTITRADGSIYTLNGSLVRGDGGTTRERVLTNAQGETVASRNVQISRNADGQVTRNVQATGPQRLLRGNRLARVRANGPRGARRSGGPR